MLKLCVRTGDPRLPDSSKRGQRYNEEDAATHAAMRAALEGLRRFALEVLDDHARRCVRRGIERGDGGESDIPALIEAAARLVGT